MKTTRLCNMAFAAAVTGGLALTPTTARPQGDLGLKSSLTLAPASGDSSGGGAGADDEKAKEAELVKKTLNPIASLISVPFQNNWDFHIGPSDAMKYTMNFQPVIPILAQRGLERNQPDDPAHHLPGIHRSRRQFQIRPR